MQIENQVVDENKQAEIVVCVCVVYLLRNYAR